MQNQQNNCSIVYQPVIHCPVVLIKASVVGLNVQILSQTLTPVSLRTGKILADWYTSSQLFESLGNQIIKNGHCFLWFVFITTMKLFFEDAVFHEFVKNDQYILKVSYDLMLVSVVGRLGCLLHFCLD